MAKVSVRGQFIEKDRTASPRTLAKYTPANKLNFVTTSTNWVYTRVGLGRYAMVHSNVDETSLIIDTFDVGAINTNTTDTSRGEVARGARILSAWIDYFNPSTGGADLDAAVTATIQTLAWVDASAVAAATDRPVTAAGGSATKSDTLMRRTTFTVTTPFVVTTAMVPTIEVTFDNAATSDAQVYGIGWNYDYLL